jgi:hypothetical protein
VLEPADGALHSPSPLVTTKRPTTLRLVFGLPVSPVRSDHRYALFRHLFAPQSLSVFHANAIVYRPVRARQIRLELALIRRRSDTNPLLDMFCTLALEVGMQYTGQFRKTSADSV